MKLLPAALAAVTLVIHATPARAQVDRVELIQAARQASVEAERRDLYLAAAEPVAQDSLWAVAVYELAQVMLDVGDEAAAGAWMRWATRHGTWGIDRAYFAPSLVGFYDQAVAAVGPEPAPEGGVAATAWRWPDTFAAEAQGGLALGDPADGAVPGLAVTVTGAGPLEPGAPLTLAPGSYELVASAAGYDPLRLEREVLPGVEAVIAFDLAPLLPESVAQEVGGSVVRLRPMEAGAAGAVDVCRNGLAVGGGFVVTSLSGLGGATRLELLRPGATDVLEAELLRSDAGADVAVLRAPTFDGRELPAGSPEDASFGWSVYRAGCDAGLGAARSRLTDSDPVAPFPAAALGAPVVDLGGSLLGLVGDGGRLSTWERVNEAVAAAADQLDPSGFPVMWVAAGAAAVVGGVVALLAGGGGGGGGGGSDTGTILVPLPAS